jgi:ergothioneine biosynthesis protein EgtB
MPDASPTKWHLAHTTWFFETFILKTLSPGYLEYDGGYEYLFNSYYNSVGAMHPRPERGLLTRPTLEEIQRYRAHVDEAMDSLLERCSELGREQSSRISDLTRIGLNHEQQHQELILTDIKHAFSRNPAFPAYADSSPPPGPPIEIAWLPFRDGIRRIGHEEESFAFDNEMPRHRRFVDAFRIANRPVTNAEYAEFVADDGYSTATLWLSDGWQTVQERNWTAPLYWHGEKGSLTAFTLAGLRELDPNGPVCHVSYYEADAFARWSGARLPTEAEWEVASAAPMGATGSMLEDATFHPALFPPGRASGKDAAHGMFGGVWEWSASPYTAYPGFKTAEGALGEYNGKFMSNQMVLRGGSCATAHDHIRPTYRNFFPPNARWQFSGIRLARDGDGAS